MSLPNVFFFTGENDFRLSRELSRWKKEFAEKHGSENLLLLPAKDLQLTTLLDSIATAPFIAEKRLVVIEGLPKFEKEDVQKIADNIHPQTILVFAESKPDKRLSVTKELQKIATIKEWKPFSPKELITFVQETAKAHGASIDPQTAQFLIDFVGNDPWMLESEIMKIAISAPEKIITRDRIELLSVPSGERIIWGMTNLLGEKRIHEAIRFFREQLDRGEEPYGIWAILLNMVKNVVLVWAALQSGMKDMNSIGRELKVSPFVVRGVLPLAKSLTPEQIEELTSFVADADVSLKSGGYKYTVEHQEEVIALIERAMLTCA